MKTNEKILHIMEKKGLNTLKLSRAIGESNSTLTDFLKGKTTKISLDKALKIARVLDVSVEYLADDEVDDENYGRWNDFTLSDDEAGIITLLRQLDKRGYETVRNTIYHQIAQTDITTGKDDMIILEKLIEENM